MRTLMLIFVALGLAALGSAADEGFSVGNVKPPLPPKPAGEPYTPPPDGPRLQGDTIADPFIISGLPYSASGMTCGFVNDYDEVCPYSGSTSPDVVFRYDCDYGTYLPIDLCGSTFDTKVYVYENSIGNLIACNDDYCDYQSYLSGVPFAAGNTYYIVVDGYGGSCGNYYLQLYPISSGCYIECPAGAMPEGEPDCYDGYNDTYNGGCNVTPFPVFQVLEPSSDPIVICGATGVYMFGSSTYRDTDWFEVDLACPSQICVEADAEIPCYCFIIDGRGGCDGLQVVATGEPGMCAPMSDLCYDCDAGIWWLWIGPRDWTLYGCGHTYWMDVTGYTGSASPAPATTWAQVKGLFR